MPSAAVLLGEAPGVVTPEAAEGLLRSLDLEGVSLRELYRTGCERWARRVNSQVLAALPTSLGAYEVVDSLDLDSCYIGAAGLGPLMPVIICCERLRRLSLRSNGLRRDGVLALCEAAMRHPSLCELDLSGNEIGTTAGGALLKLVDSNRRVRAVGCADALVIPALQRKIHRRADINAEGADSVPPGAFRYIPMQRDGAEEPSEEVLAAEREARERREAERKRILDTLPYWMPPACEEFSEALYVHANHLRDVLSLFAPEKGEPHACTPSEFQRVLRVLGCRFAEADGGRAEEGRDDKRSSPPRRRSAAAAGQRESAFPQLVGCLRGGLVHYEELIAIFRTHAVIAANPSWPPADGTADSAAQQALLDAVFDSREGLREAFVALADSADGLLQRDELLSGLAAIPVCGACGGVDAARRRECADALLSAAGYPTERETVPGVELLAGLAVAEQRPAAQWRRLGVDSLLQLRRRLGHNPPPDGLVPERRRPRVGDRVVLAPVSHRTPWGQDPNHWGVLGDGGAGTVVADDGGDCVPLRIERASDFDLYNCQDVVVVSFADEAEAP